MHTLRPGIETPLQVFAILRRYLELRRAALLLPSRDEQFFAPWAVTGFDQTTERRLRLPFPFVDELFADGMEARLVANDDDLQRVRPYVSSRELTSETPLAFFPIGTHGRPLAIIVIAASPYLEEAPSVLRVIMSAINEPVATLLERHRERRFDAARNRAMFSARELNEHPEELLSGQETPLACIRLECDAFLRAVDDHFAEADRFRVKQDLARIVAAVVSGLGILVDVPTNALLLFLSRADRIDLDLLQRHIEFVIHRHFVDLEDRIELPMSVRTQQNESLDEFVRALL